MKFLPRRFPVQAISVSLNLVFELFLPIAICTRIASPSYMSTPIPPSVDSNDDRGPQLIKSVVACCVLSGVAVAGRLASRKIKKSKFKASDYLVTAGLVGSWVMSGITIVDGEQSCFILNVGILCSYRLAATLGLGKHIEVVPLRHVEIFRKVCTFEKPLLNAETSRACNHISDHLRSHPNADQDLNPFVLP